MHRARLPAWFMPRLLWLGLVLILAGCAETRVATDFTPGIDYLRYHSFAWVAPEDAGHEIRPIWDNALLTERIAANVSLVMKSKGYREAPPAQADMLISYKVSSRQKIASYDYGAGYFARPFWIQQGTDVYSYEEGTLAIDILDAKTHKLIWRGWTSTIVNDEPLPTKTVNAMINKILARFPPGAQSP